MKMKQFSQINKYFKMIVFFAFIAVLSFSVNAQTLTKKAITIITMDMVIPLSHLQRYLYLVKEQKQTHILFNLHKI
jgi:hypothetical protein